MMTKDIRFLLDTNCWMQLVRDREHARIVHKLLNTVSSCQFAISDMALHSLVIIMRRHKMLAVFETFLRSSSIGINIELIRMQPEDLIQVIEVSLRYNLDVDDAYQYVAAELNGLKLVSLDADFDKTPNGRLTPEAALKLYEEQTLK
jgi:uncharacterized protein